MSDKSESRIFFEKIAEVMPGECVINDVPVGEDGKEWIQFSYGAAKIRATVDGGNVKLSVTEMPLKVTFSSLPGEMELVKIPLADPKLFDRIPLALGGFLNRSIDDEITKYEEELDKLKEIRSIDNMKDKITAYLGEIK